ncbi:MAG TPA: amidohydrolase family protein [Actinomycetota bacterium]
MSAVIDAHSHLFPPGFIERLRARPTAPRITGGPDGDRLIVFASEERTGGRPVGRSFIDPAEKLRFMDRLGIDRAAVQMANPLLEPFDGQEAVDAAAELNAEMAGLLRASGGRLAGLGALPQHDLAAAAAAAEQVAATDTLFGIASGPLLCRRQLDDPELDPLWGLLERLDVPVTIHPQRGLPVPELEGHGLALSLGLSLPFETTVAVARLVLGGVLQRFPGLRILAAHGGGALPFLADRLDAVWRTDPRAREQMPLPPSTDLGRLWLDGLVYGPAPLRAALALAGPERVLFGTDHPYVVADAERNLAAIDEATDGGADALAVRGGVAERFFGLT